MKKVINIIGKVLQWVAAGFISICALANGFHYSSLFLLLAMFFAMPIPPVRRLLKKLKIKPWLIAVIAAALFITGLAASPASPPEEPDVDGIVEDSDESDDTTLADITEADTTGAVADKETSADTTALPSVETKAPETTKKPESTKPASPSVAPVGNGNAKPVNPSSLPAYSGKPYAVVNNNVPNFTSAELTTKSYEKYSSLDSLGRCGVTIASVGKDIMPTEDRGSIGQVKPTGWHTVKYDCVDGKYLYNRCHLIGFQLTGENANTKNLITGTRYLNVDGMLPFENMVADYVKETGNHVAYRVTPIFEGNNLLASGVQMEAYSVEDKGAGICFNVYCYNVQPGVKINYATGESTLSEASKPETSAPVTQAPATQPPATEDNNSETYILNTNTKKFHREGCRHVSTIAEHNKGVYEGDRQDLIDQGYDPCKNCDP